MKKNTGPGRPKLPEASKRVHFSTTLPAKDKAFIFRSRQHGESAGNVVSRALAALRAQNES